MTGIRGEREREIGGVENDHNVYLLGAGFSHAAGMPLMADFMQRMREASQALPSEPAYEARDDIREVLGFRLRAAAAAYRVDIDVENIEQLFSLASALPEPRLTAAMSRAICATLDFAGRRGPARTHRVSFDRDQTPVIPAAWRGRVVEDEPGYGSPIVDAPLYEVMIGRLLGLRSDGSMQGRNTILSFNYDLVVEQALSGLGIDPDYGLPLQRPKSIGDSAPIRPRVDLLKLHGSMNLTKLPGIEDAGVTVESFAETLRLGEAPWIVPPTWAKRFDGDLSQVWARAVQCLRDATRIVMIGFSFPETDMHVKYLLASALMDNISLRQVVVVVPQGALGDVCDRVRAILRPPLPVLPIGAFAEDFLVTRNSLPALNRSTEW